MKQRGSGPNFLALDLRCLLIKLERLSFLKKWMKQSIRWLSAIQVVYIQFISDLLSFNLTCFEGLRNSVNGLFAAVVVVGRIDFLGLLLLFLLCQLPMLKERIPSSALYSLHFLNIRNSRWLLLDSDFLRE